MINHCCGDDFTSGKQHNRESAVCSNLTDKTTREDDHLPDVTTVIRYCQRSSFVSFNQSIFQRIK